jgi:hybrid cluster-associated redox disulfide protein
MITRDTKIAEAMRSNPKVAGILARYGGHCTTCRDAGRNTVGDMAARHDLELDRLLQELNETSETGAKTGNKAKTKSKAKTKAETETGA